jgi:hypothetical protein
MGNTRSNTAAQGQRAAVSDLPSQSNITSSNRVAATPWAKTDAA